MGHLAGYIYAYGYAGAFSLLLLGIVGLPIPDEWLLLFLGYLVYKGQLHFVPALACAALGAFGGISLSFALGRTVGALIVRKYGPRIRLPEERVEKVRAWFERSGRWVLVIGFFIPGVRHLVGFSAGSSRIRYREFALFASAGAASWSAVFLTAGYMLGKEWESGSRAVHRDILTGVVIAAVLLLALRLLREKTRRKR